MADLFDRLFPASGESRNISVHAFMAAITDYIAGHTTQAQIIGVWSLDSDAQSDLIALCSFIDNLSSKEEKIVFALEFDAVMLLVESKLKYNTKSAFRARLGI